MWGSGRTGTEQGGAGRSRAEQGGAGRSRAEHCEQGEAGRSRAEQGEQGGAGRSRADRGGAFIAQPARHNETPCEACGGAGRIVVDWGQCGPQRGEAARGGAGRFGAVRGGKRRSGEGRSDNATLNTSILAFYLFSMRFCLPFFTVALADRTTDQPSDRPTVRLTDRPIDRPIVRSIKRLTYRQDTPTDQPRLFHRPNEGTTDRQIDPITNQHALVQTDRPTNNIRISTDQPSNLVYYIE